MRILQIGGGSMGTRRMRDLHDRDGVSITLVDPRPDRRARAAERFGVAAVSTVEEGLADKPDVLVISTPPDQHAPYLELALSEKLHFFCEADIWSAEPAAMDRPGLVAAPSATLRFHPFIRELRRVVATELGTLHAYGYLLSVDAPGWHPGEGTEYYARHRATAPAREMMPFELIALDYVFGPAVRAAGRVTQRGQLDQSGEDTFNAQLELANGATGTLCVAMASPQTVRQGWAVGDRGFIRFDLLAGTLERAFPTLGDAYTRTVCDWAAAYEPMYHDEMTAFLAAVRGEAEWPYPYATAATVCATLAAVERSAVTGRIEPVDPARQPAPLPDAY